MPLATPGDCTLHEALVDANANNNQPAVDTITFNIPGAGPHRINATSTFFVTEPVHIDGTTEPSFVAPTPAIILDGSGPGPM